MIDHQDLFDSFAGLCVITLTKLGFFVQLKRKLTKKGYHCATIFVNHYSCLQFVHLQVNDSSIKTVAAKRAFETFAGNHGVKILHYYCDDGRFSDNAFKQACHDACQKLTFCGVNAHFQSGITKRRICNISKSACKLLLQARA